LQQLVAPIALYPDELVGQVLAAATYPDEIVEADRWVQANSSLKGEELGRAVDNQSWDPSVKALTEFPSVLANMDKNLSWTSSLGDAYVNQQQAVMDAVQAMRQRAQQAGHLEGNGQQKVTTQGSTIAIEPANPQFVYVPQYNPWLVYGTPVAAWPGWYGYPGLFWDGPGIGFGLGFGLGMFAGFGWGWGHWGFDWRNHEILNDHRAWASHGRAFSDRRAMADRGHGGSGHGGFGHGGGGAFHRGGHGDSHGGGLGHNGAPGGGFHGGGHAAPRSGAFGGFNHGGVSRGFGAAGRGSFGGGGHGGGGHR
jgi:hypothetical protein